MKNNKNYVVIVLLVAVVSLGIYLLIRKPKYSKTVYFAETKLSIAPELGKGKIDGQIGVQLIAETGNGAKISSIDTQICYGNELSVDEADPSSQVELNTEALGLLVDVSIVGEDNKCLRLVAIANLDKKPEDLVTGTVPLATIKFLAKLTGSGEIIIDGSKTKVGGYNPKPGATDNAIKVEEIKNAGYVISI